MPVLFIYAVYYCILGIIHERKRLRISRILVHSQTFSCIISFQKGIIHNRITKSITESCTFLTNSVTINISQKLSFTNDSRYMVFIISIIVYKEWPFVQMIYTEIFQEEIPYQGYKLVIF